jgi:BirA family biotin operon repressor/biotin-[acetyl-CoA-carboxylase] ligase
MTDELTEARLRTALGQRPFRLYTQIGSTNDAAREWAKNGGSEGAVVIAEEQTAGRGRFARRWDAPPGTALLLSVIIRPQPTQSDYLARLPLVGALAVVETLATLGAQDAAIKWPNDALLNGRKVAGILAETDWQGDRPTVGILGIGLNVRIDFTRSELEMRAISVEPALGLPIDRAALLATVLARVDYWTARLEHSALIEAWRSKLVTLGQRITANLTSDSQAAPIAGVAIGVDDFGALLVQTDDGKMHRLVAGEITLRSSRGGT